VALATAARLHYDVHPGDGPYLLLVHGFLSSRAQWLPNIGALSAVARPVVVELWGHGRSPSPEDALAYTPEAYGRQFEVIRQDLGVERWLVIGQSLGAAITLRYSLDYAERVIAQAFTNSTSALADENWEPMVRAAMVAQADRLRADGRRAIAEHPLNPARSARLPEDVRAAFESDSLLHDPEGLAMTGLHTIPTSSVRPRVNELSVPTLLVAGERESRFAPHRRFAEAHMPMLEVVGLEGGHAVNIDAADEFNVAVTGFLRKHIDLADDTGRI
jgi:pimeloyl-ACP methyl ester carboxylesterase